ncbi:MAG: hypothetical protein EA378_02755 [Phycisphaerales bacterium]|nr:MAG: hypothetical protein EA378_02755 [Phycisphaerales bacterium]
MVEHASLEGFGSPAERAARLDALMERASAALTRTDYFQAIELASTALRRAHQQRDYERMARICLPLQEARRQVRQLASDAGASGGVFVVARAQDLPERLAPGCYLVQPPMIGAEGRQLADTLSASRVAGLVVTREPMTSGGQWPIVAVGASIVRTRVTPPPCATPKAGCLTRDELRGTPPVSWFEHASETLGDAAIAAATGEGAALVDELLALLEATPEHEKLHQRLADVCRAIASTDNTPNPAA